MDITKYKTDMNCPASSPTVAILPAMRVDISKLDLIMYEWIYKQFGHFYDYLGRRKRRSSFLVVLINIADVTVAASISSDGL